MTSNIKFLPSFWSDYMMEQDKDNRNILSLLVMLIEIKTLTPRVAEKSYDKILKHAQSMQNSVFSLYILEGKGEMEESAEYAVNNILTF
jgi:hypothetical protein